MNRALLKKNVVDARLLFAALALLLFTFCWLRLFVVSSLEMTQFATIIEQVWEQFKSFVPVPLDQLLSYTGRIALAYNEPIVVFGVSMFAIARGSDVVSGELSRGTLEMLLAQPVSRVQVLWSHSAVTVTSLALLCVLTWVGTIAGIHTTSVREDAPPPTLRIPGLGVRIPLSMGPPKKITIPMREKTRVRYFVPGAFNLFCFGVALAGFSALVSSWDRYRWRTIGIVVSVYVISLALKLFGQAIPQIGWLQRLSVFTAYEPQKYVSIAVHMPAQTWALGMYDARGVFVDLGPLGYNLILLAVGIVSYVVAAVIFHRRDLPAPL